MSFMTRLLEALGPEVQNVMYEGVADKLVDDVIDLHRKFVTAVDPVQDLALKRMRNIQASLATKDTGDDEVAEGARLVMLDLWMESLAAFEKAVEQSRHVQAEAKAKQTGGQGDAS